MDNNNTILSNEEMEEIKKIYNKYFKDSLLNFREPHFSDLKNKYIYINCYLAKDKTEVYNTYLENDMFNLSFELVKNNNEFTILCTSSSYLIKPVFETWMAYNRIKVIFRKKRGTFKEILKHLEKHFIKFNASLKDSLNKNYICDRDDSDYYGRDVSHLHILQKHLI